MRRVVLSGEKLMANRFQLPNLGIGLGLRTTHYTTSLEQKPAVDWFEILSENYLRTQGRPLDFLDRIAESYPIAMHGVSLSIGSTDPRLTRGCSVCRRWMTDRGPTRCWGRT